MNILVDMYGVICAWHALTLLTLQDEHPRFDDRYKKEDN